MTGLGAQDDGGSGGVATFQPPTGGAATGGATDTGTGGRAPLGTDAGTGGADVATDGGSGGATGPACGLGETRACLGPGACSGAQECRGDRSGFGPCDCGSGSGGAGSGGTSSGGIGSGGAPLAGGGQAGTGGESGSGGTSGAWYEGPTPIACTPTQPIGLPGPYQPNAAGQEGGCLFVTDVPQELRADFGRSTCPEDHHCMPCVRFTTTITGACPP
jgi:hypothetical protein